MISQEPDNKDLLAYFSWLSGSDNQQHNWAKSSSTFQKKIQTIRRKWMIDQFNVKLLKHESRQLHHLCDKLIAEGRLSLEELKSNVDSREKAKNILLKR
jgi:hypothetical protein